MRSFYESYVPKFLELFMSYFLLFMRLIGRKILEKYRTMILIEFEDQEATVVWAGNHQEYESVFRNNKVTIKKWLRKNGWIQ
ncbi:type II toxin-antitoxin system HigB family toxin [Litoribacter ruber]|uniref:Type II toxin-antitoxin system HigB family toxin n=1 Tax=Litoribacter ruber TaxID=702568 RepID=A0AAP2CKW6_9BACT|nr:type II toxin-antitoxin system HigB family toxin [Litoribacter alkaliphilus]MBT0813126.1 type II toxin-antitoxin system HigB family toxin [Litoribacter ruber]